MLKTNAITSTDRPEKGSRIFVGLSGGVDSAVSAALLKKRGYDVTGVFIKVWQPDFLPCTWREERRDAMRVCARLKIPFLFFDFEDEYKKEVIDRMIHEYKKGRTPNPDILCNREIKFGAFWKKARELGADFIATGHYARVTSRSILHEPAKADNLHLLEGVDKDKDQSYFLWTLKAEDLKHILFPIGNLEKKEVRKLAKRYKLPVAEKKDSQGICFLGDVDMEDFLSHFIKTKSGRVLDVEGKIIGKHRGALYYTIGERHGFDIEVQTPKTKPFFVIAKDMKRNTITVTDDLKELSFNLPTEMKLERVNWITKPNTQNPEARIRYRQKRFPVKIFDGERVLFTSAQASASGQSIVFYQGEECLGGAILAS